MDSSYCRKSIKSTTRKVWTLLRFTYTYERHAGRPGGTQVFATHVCQKPDPDWTLKAWRRQGLDRGCCWCSFSVSGGVQSLLEVRGCRTSADCCMAPHTNAPHWRPGEQHKKTNVFGIQMIGQCVDSVCCCLLPLIRKCYEKHKAGMEGARPQM